MPEIFESRLPVLYEVGALAQLPGGANSLRREVVAALTYHAEAALGRGPYSVVNKTDLPPSGDRHDYLHPAPYFWPRGVLGKWLPMRRRDGRRVPGTRLYEPESERYDRTRAQRLFDDTTVLALAWGTTGEANYVRQAVRLIETWFIADGTRMNPNLNFAQVRLGKDEVRGRKSGIIEFKDLYFFLDAVKLLHASAEWTPSIHAAFGRWLENYLDWLLTSVQGREEAESRNNHGTCFELQLMALATYLDLSGLAAESLERLPGRMRTQFDSSGFQPFEAERSLSRHYFAFNLQSWVHLALYAQAHGLSLWHSDRRGEAGLERPLRYFLDTRGRGWAGPQIEPFDERRYDPLLVAYHAYCSRAETSALSSSVEPLCYPHYGIRPFWLLTKPMLEHLRSAGTGIRLPEKPV